MTAREHLFRHHAPGLVEDITSLGHVVINGRSIDLDAAPAPRSSVGGVVTPDTAPPTGHHPQAAS